MKFLTAFMGAVATGATQATSNDTLTTAVVSGCFLIANGVITVFLTRALGEKKRENKDTDSHAASDTDSGTGRSNRRRGRRAHVPYKRSPGHMPSDSGTGDSGNE